MAKQRNNVISLPVQSPGITVEQAAEAFLERDFSANTLRSFHSDLARFCERFEGQPAMSVSSDDIKAYLDGLRNREGRPVSPATLNRHHGTLNNLFSWLVRQGEVDSNPMERLERRRTEERLPQPMSHKQIDTLFGRIDGLREKALFSLLYRSGLRVQEALSLDIEDLDLVEGVFTVRGKGGYERVCYLSEKTKPLLRRYIRARNHPWQGPLFASRQGRLSYATARLMFRKHAEGMTRPDGRPLGIHQLRHSFGSERAGKIDALVLRDLMGHKSIRTTLQYTKVNPERTRQAFKEFDREEAKKLPKR